MRWSCPAWSDRPASRLRLPRLPHREGAPATNFLYGIGAYSPSDMWTVGYSRNPGQIGISLAIRYDGNTWQIVNTPNPTGSISNVLYSVADHGPTNAIAVGTYQDGATFEERALAMNVPQIGTTTQLLAVAGVSRTAVAAVGVTATGAFAERLSLYWNGRRYIDVPAGDYSNLRRVARDPAGFWWSVGHDLGQSVIQRIGSP